MQELNIQQWSKTSPRVQMSRHHHHSPHWSTRFSRNRNKLATCKLQPSLQHLKITIKVKQQMKCFLPALWYQCQVWSLSNTSIKRQHIKWFRHENDSLPDLTRAYTKRAECRAIGRSRKQRMDNLKGILNKRNYDVTIYLVLEPN